MMPRMFEPIAASMMPMTIGASPTQGRPGVGDWPKHAS
jgi:hypothetical protein